MILILYAPLLMSIFIMLYIFVLFIWKQLRPNYHLIKMSHFFVSIFLFSAYLLFFTLSGSQILIIPLIFFITLTVTSSLFNKYQYLSNHSWYDWFYFLHYISIALIFLNILSHYYFMGYNIIGDYIKLCLSAIAIVYFFIIILRLIDRLSHFTNRKNHSHNKKKINNKIEHYRKQGLSEEEIIYFREQMKEAKHHIIMIEESINQTAKLRAIATKHDIIKVCQSFFQSIVKYPTKFNQAGNFLFKTLPSLEDLISKYNEINGHVAKNKQTYLILEKTAKVIDNLCKQTIEDYLQFHHDIFQDLDDEIKLAELNLKRHSYKSNQSSNSDINQMIKDTENILNNIEKESSNDEE